MTEVTLTSILVKTPHSISQARLRAEIRRFMGSDTAFVSAGPPTMPDLLSEIGMTAGLVTKIHEHEDETAVDIQLLDTPRGRMVRNVMLATAPKGLPPVIVETTWKGDDLVRMTVAPASPGDTDARTDEEVT